MPNIALKYFQWQIEYFYLTTKFSSRFILMYHFPLLFSSYQFAVSKQNSSFLWPTNFSFLTTNGPPNGSHLLHPLAHSFIIIYHFFFFLPNSIRKHRMEGGSSKRTLSGVVLNLRFLSCICGADFVWLSAK